MSKDLEIACPRCDWKPDGGAYWMCTCGCVWNTFDTAARCPKCSKQWTMTECPGPHFPGGCGAASPHEAWYRNLDEILEEELEDVFLEEPATVEP